jgi:hypothetical protein
MSKNKYFSALDSDNRSAHVGYIRDRWQQLSNAEKEYSSEALKYLFLVNSGAAVAVLAFIGANQTFSPPWWAKAMLGSFLSGIVILGFGHAFRVHRMQQTFRSFRHSVPEYYEDKLAWDDVLDRDRKKSAPTFLGYAIPYLSFSCFIAGIAIGLTNLPEATGVKDGITRQTSTSPHQAHLTQTSTSTPAGSSSVNTTAPAAQQKPAKKEVAKQINK